MSGEKDATMFAALSGEATVTRSAPHLIAARALRAGEPEYVFEPPMTSRWP